MTTVNTIRRVTTRGVIGHRLQCSECAGRKIAWRTDPERLVCLDCRNETTSAASLAVAERDDTVGRM